MQTCTNGPVVSILEDLGIRALTQKELAFKLVPEDPRVTPTRGATAEGGGAMSKKRRNGKKHMGSSIEDFLKDEGIFEEAQAQAVKEVVAWQLDEAMKKQKIYAGALRCSG
jgi:hypothetical protein